MTRVTRPTLVALACATLVGLMYVSPVLPDVRRVGLDWPIWIDHPEGLIHTNTGKWLVAPPHRFFVEGASGEFPQYYAGLSDTLLNLVACPFGIPAMTVQAVLYGPLLGASFLLLNYVSLAAVLADRRAALAASLVLSLGGNASFWDRTDPASGLPLNAILHVPFHALSLGTSQSLGWVLLLPTLCLCHLAYRELSLRRALGAGLLLGALFYAHTLSFVNVAAVVLAHGVLANAHERPRDWRFRAWLSALAVLLALFVLLAATRPTLSFASLAGLGTMALVATFWIDPNKRYYLWTFAPAALLALPYVALLVRHRAPLAEMQGGWNHVQLMTVTPQGALLFFSAYLAAAALAYRWARGHPLLGWLTTFLATTAFLAVNHLWHWGNHPYRYAIHLLFPLVILGVLGLQRAPRPVAVLLGAWVAAVCASNAWSFAAGRPYMVRFRVAEPERARFLETVRAETARAAASGQRLLPPVELTYPRGLVQAAWLMNYSRIPAFIPDYRHVLWPERHHNRMALYCFLFPGYPNLDYPFGWRACEEALDPDPELVTVLEPRLKAAILPLYRIAFAAAPAKPFSNYLKDAVPRYGWPLVTQTDNAAFVRTESVGLPGVARLAPGEAGRGSLAIVFEPDAAGPHVIVLGGRRLDRRAPQPMLDGRALGGTRRGYWAVLHADLAKGPHRLELPALREGTDPEADYLYFAAVVRRDVVSSYLALGPAAADAASP